MTSLAVQTNGPNWFANEQYLRDSLRRGALVDAWKRLCTIDELVDLNKLYPSDSSRGLIILKPDFIARHLGEVIFPFIKQVCGLEILSAKKVALSEESVRLFWPTILSLEAWIESAACFVDKPLVQVVVQDRTGCAIRRCLLIKRLLRRILCDDQNPSSRLIHTSDSSLDMDREIDVLKKYSIVSSVFSKISEIRELSVSVSTLEIGQGFIFFAERPSTKNPKKLCVFTNSISLDFNASVATLRRRHPNVVIDIYDLQAMPLNITELFQLALFIRGNAEAFLFHRQAYLSKRP